MLIAQQSSRPDEESGMFTKKYVGPVNCASCEKNITNLLAQPVDYHVWKRLPFREPSERIARVRKIENYKIGVRLIRRVFSLLVRSRFLKDFDHDAPQ